MNPDPKIIHVDMFAYYASVEQRDQLHRRELPMQSLSPKIFEDLIRDVQAGSEEAAVLLFERCRKPLLAIIRELLSFPLRKLYDSDDFLLETYAVILTYRRQIANSSSPKYLCHK